MSCSCPRRCRPWQGKFISRSGRTTEITDLNGRKYKVYPLSQTSYGEPDGLFGINCGHRPRGVSDGLFTRTAKVSEEYGADDEKVYYKVCKQRELERKVRKSKTEADMLDAAGDSEGARTVRQKANQYNKELKSYCQQNGLKYRSDRVRTYGAIEPKKSLDKSAGSGIIEVNNTMIGEAELTQYTTLGNVNPDYLTDEFGELQTREVIVTNERVEHIKDHHPDDIKLFEQYGSKIISDPDVIIKDSKNEGTVFMIGKLPETNLNVVVRLALSGDTAGYKNSVMTFYRIREKNLVKLKNKNKVLYNRE